MVNASPGRWKSHPPGGIDRLNVFWLPAEFENEFPVIKNEYIDAPTKIIPFRRHPRKNECVHFFIDNFEFECVWDQPEKYAKMYSGKTILSPDFSYDDSYPLPAQIWQAYRNRWVGAYMQDNGIRVIPTVSWGSESTFDFCFSGVQAGSMVAISTNGYTEKSEIFSNGFDEMMHQIQPSVILCCGDIERIYTGVYSKSSWMGEGVVTYISASGEYTLRV